MKKNFKPIIFYAVLIIGIIFAVSTIMDNREPVEDPVLSDVVDYFEQDKVISFNVDENMVLKMNVLGENSEAVYDENTKSRFL